MAKDSKIEWTHHTFNPWWGCVKVSAACDHCYAETWAKRLGEDIWGAKSQRRFFSDAHWNDPVKWNKEAETAGERRRVFCASMADVFENRDDLIAPRSRLFNLIEATPHLDWLLLTKRIHLVAKLIPTGRKLAKNVWLGTTVENQDSAKKRIKYLLKFTEPAVRFLSCEPLLGSLDLSPWLGPQKEARLDWVIAGGESGAGSRPMNPEWVIDLQAQCERSKVAFHFKQWGHWAPLDQADVVPGKKFQAVELIRMDGSIVTLSAMGKGKAGRRLQGQVWDQFPVLAA
jgi:protein gp37